MGLSLECPEEEAEAAVLMQAKKHFEAQGIHAAELQFDRTPGREAEGWVRAIGRAEVISAQVVLHQAEAERVGFTGIRKANAH